MEKRREYNPYKLLPAYFRYIGMGIIAVLVIAYFVCFSDWEDFKNHRILRDLFEMGVIFALFIIAMAKERVLDERLVELRLKATFHASYAIPCFVFSMRVVDMIIFGVAGQDLDLHLYDFLLAVIAFLFYFEMYALLKRRG